MPIDDLLQSKQHISTSLETEIGTLMGRIEEGIEDEDLEVLVAVLLTRVRAAAEVTRQILSAEAEVRGCQAAVDALRGDGGDALSIARAVERVAAAREHLETLVQTLGTLRGEFDV